MLTDKQTEAAVVYNAERLLRFENTGRFAELVAHWQATHGLEVDGKYGPRTDASVETARAPAPAPAPAPVSFDGPLTTRPNGVAALNAAYGDPTRGGLYLRAADPVWEKTHLKTFDPGTLPLVPATGDGRYVTVNEAMAPYLVEGLNRADEAAGKISSLRPEYRVGGYNFRRMRHDTPEKAAREGRPLRPLSRHAWGCAVDVDPGNNAPTQFDPGRRPEPWSGAWMKIWPRGLPRWFVEAMESVGFRWGGRWTGFCDPMHFELAGGEGVPL